MVRNPDDIYEWVSSSSGKIVQNALKNQHHGRFEIGRVQIDDKVYVGAVSFMDGLVFTDYRGLKQTSRNYEVLTCSSSKKSDGF